MQGLTAVRVFHVGVCLPAHMWRAAAALTKPVLTPTRTLFTQCRPWIVWEISWSAWPEQRLCHARMSETSSAGASIDGDARSSKRQRAAYETVERKAALQGEQPSADSRAAAAAPGTAASQMQGGAVPGPLPDTPFCLMHTLGVPE